MEQDATGRGGMGWINRLHFVFFVFFLRNSTRFIDSRHHLQSFCVVQNNSTIFNNSDLSDSSLKHLVYDASPLKNNLSIDSANKINTFLSHN